MADADGASGSAAPPACAPFTHSAVDLNDRHLLNKGLARGQAAAEHFGEAACAPDEPDEAPDEHEEVALDAESAAELAMMAAMGMPVSFGGAAARGRSEAAPARRSRPQPQPRPLAGCAQPSGTHTRFDGDAAATAALTAAADASGKPAGVPPKYWAQRYRLFSRYDEGAAVEGEMWFSVTPEAIAAHQALRAARSGARLVVDAFAGAGGNTVAFAARGAFAVGVDVDASRLRAARRNAALYAAAGRCDFVRADWTTLAPALARHRPRGLAPDLLFLSPPWGGPDYLCAPSYDLSQPMANGAPAATLLTSALTLSPRCAFFLPRNCAPDDVAALARGAAGGCRAELEDVHLNGVKKACTLYVGDAFERGSYGCDACGQYGMPCAAALEAHLSSKRHLAQTVGAPVAHLAFGCPLCGIPAMNSAEQLSAHRSSKRHVKAAAAAEKEEQRMLDDVAT